MSDDAFLAIVVGGVTSMLVLAALLVRHVAGACPGRRRCSVDWTERERGAEYQIGVCYTCGRLVRRGRG